MLHDPTSTQKRLYLNLKFQNIENLSISDYRPVEICYGNNKPVKHNSYIPTVHKPKHQEYM